MTLEEKKQKILNAYNAGMPKKTIDPIGEGSSVNILLKGGKPSARKIEQMHINVVSYQEEQTKIKNLNLLLAPSESLTRYQKEQIIIQAIEAGISKYKINPSSQGASIDRLLKGKNLWPKTVEQIYTNLLECLGYGNSSKQSDEKKFYEQKIKSLETIIISLSRQIESLQIQQQKLQTQYKSLAHLPQPNSKSSRQICGLTIISKKDKVRGRYYNRFYAIYKYKSNGKSKRKFIYIGKDLSKAQEKIQAALLRLGVKS